MTHYMNLLLNQLMIDTFYSPFWILLVPSEARNIDVVKYYLSEGTIDINAKCTTDKEENTALTKAIINDKIDIAKLLLKNDKIDPNIKSNSYDSKNQYNNNGSYYTV